jgi:hypothetical protein
VKGMCERESIGLDGRSAVIVAAALLQGCVGSQIVPMSAETSASLQQAPVVQVVRYQSGALNIATPKDAVGGGLLASATGSSELPTGGSLSRAYGLPDPAEDVGRRLVEKLKIEGRLPNVRLEPASLPRPWVEDPSHYRNRYQSGLVLEISVENQNAVYGAMNWKTYTYGFAGRGRLIRLADGKVLWLDTCNLHAFADDAAKRRLDVSEFEANKAARLKEVMQYSTERCSQILADKLLGKT